MHVIGTAGHIDHGKSTLIRALAGMEPDRLQEEQARGMTIDLGFAWASLPSGRDVGMVDVPGHHKFIKNMLAGAGNVDLALLIVGANEGWMPQTEEHLRILDLLGVHRGIVVLTKKDLVEDDWLELVEEEVAERLAGRALTGAPILAVASTTGEGLDTLRGEMDRMLDEAPVPRDLGRPHLWIDRAFSVKGTGTVVTGTLADGTLHLDQEVRLLPGLKRARVRGLQSHKRAVEEIGPGHRVAVNLGGVDLGQVERGQLLIVAGDEAGCFETQRFHAHVRFPDGLRAAAKDVRFVKVYAGTAEVNGRLRHLEEGSTRQGAPDRGGPGESGLVELELDRPLPLRHRDPIILRDPSRQETLGGGIVADPMAPRVRGKRHRVVGTGRELDVERLREWAEAPPDRLPELLLKARSPILDSEFKGSLPVPSEEIERLRGELESTGRAVRFASYWMSEARWRAWAQEVERRLQDHHRQYPLRKGFVKETLRTALRVDDRLFEEAIAHGERLGLWKGEGPHLRLPDHRVTLDTAHEKEWVRLTKVLEADPFAPPTRDELVERHQFSRELLSSLVEQGRLVKVGPATLWSARAFTEAKRLLLKHIEAHGAVDVAAARDLLKTSRKYALPLLECLDDIGFTRRVGDHRVAGPRSDASVV